MGFLVYTEIVRKAVTGLVLLGKSSDSLTTERHAKKEIHPPAGDDSCMPERLISITEVAQLIRS